MNPSRRIVLSSLSIAILAASGCTVPAPEEEGGAAALDSCAMHNGDAPGCAGRTDCVWQAAPRVCAPRAEAPKPIAGTFYGYDALTHSWSSLMLTRPDAQGRGRFYEYFRGVEYRGITQRTAPNLESEGTLTLTATSPLPWSLTYTSALTTDWLGQEILVLSHDLYGAVGLIRSPYLFCESTLDCNAQQDPPQDAAWTCFNFACRPSGDVFPGEGDVP